MKCKFGVVVQPGTTRDQKMSGWRVYRPRFLQENCIGDRACELCCPDGAVYRIEKRKYDVDLDACKGCGICAEMCPVEDIVMELEETPAEEKGRHVSEEYTSRLSTEEQKKKPPGAGAGHGPGKASVGPGGDDGGEPS
jgi:pyruvate ferredoxin oxidoreductase delta subunit